MEAGKISLFFEKLGFFAVFISCFFLPLSSSIMGGAAVVAMFSWLLSARLSWPRRGLRVQLPLVLALALFGLLVLGLVSTPAPLDEALSVLKKYRELLLLPAVTLLLARRPSAAAQARGIFLAGSITLLALSYLMYFGVLPMEKYGYSTVYHITHSFFMAFLAFWALQQLLARSPYLLLWLLLLAATLGNLYLIAPGRTGMLVFLVLALLSLWQHLRWQDLVLALALGALLSLGGYSLSNNLSQRVDAAAEEIATYQANASRTSLGMRFDWWGNSLELIKAKPFLGHGVGSFAPAQQALIAGTKTKPSDNPHNEYLMLAVQSGLVGLTFFCALLATLFFQGKGLPPKKRYLLQGIVLAMATGCLMNSLLFDSHEGHFFALLTATLLAEAMAVEPEATPPA